MYVNQLTIACTRTAKGAVREITIAGDILELMKNVDAVGNDLRFFGSPSLRVKELSSGEK